MILIQIWWISQNYCIKVAWARWSIGPLPSCCLVSLHCYSVANSEQRGLGSVDVMYGCTISEPRQHPSVSKTRSSSSFWRGNFACFRVAREGRWAQKGETDGGIEGLTEGCCLPNMRTMAWKIEGQYGFGFISREAVSVMLLNFKALSTISYVQWSSHR